MVGQSGVSDALALGQGGECLVGLPETAASYLMSLVDRLVFRRLKFQPEYLPREQDTEQLFDREKVEFYIGRFR